MYYTHNLRTNLQEWRNRLHKSNQLNFENNFRFFLAKLEEVKLLKSLLEEATEEYKKDEVFLEETTKEVFDQYTEGVTFKNEKDAAATCHQIIKYLLTQGHSPNELAFNMAWGQSNDDRRESFLDNFVEPIVLYCHDQIDNGNSILYLLEKYKFRTEWFLRKGLVDKYRNGGSEQTFEDDLRLYLFDQGIDYPFSTPKSASGRADIVGQLDQDDPLVLEIKIFDSEKSYGKNKIIAGFAQIVKYSNDYNKNLGFLVIFNLDNVEVNIETTNEVKSFPKTVIFNDKSYFIIFINLNQDLTASQQGRLRIENINEKELFESKE